MAAVVLLSASGCGSTGESNDEAAKKAAAATATYREYLLDNASTLTTWSSQLRHQIKLEIVGGAQSRYASARVPFGHLKPALSSFPALDARLDAAEGSGKRAGAFHQIERMLWKGTPDKQGVRAATEIRGAALWLHQELKSASLSPAILVARARRTLDEIATSDLRLEEEPYAEIDILDASAKLEGVQAAYRALKPSLRETDPDLAEQIEDRFIAAYAAVKQFGIPARELNQPHASAPGTSFILSYQITPAELRPLSDSVERLNVLLARVQAAL